MQSLEGWKMNAKPANILGVVILVVSISWAIFWGRAAISNDTLEPVLREGPIVLWGCVVAALLLRNRKDFALYIAIATIFLLAYQAYLFDRELGLPLFTESTMPIMKFVEHKIFILRTAFKIGSLRIFYEVFVMYFLLPVLALITLCFSAASRYSNWLEMK